jgi:hypothetical protein
MIPDKITVRFVALETFHSTELQSTYERGLSYRIDPANSFLRRHAEQWLKENKIALGDKIRLRPGEGVVAGTATVGAPQPQPQPSALRRFLERMKSWL